MTELLNSNPLKLGAVAPDFWLHTPGGETITRHSWRNKTGLVVYFFSPSEPAWTYLWALAQDEAEFEELNVKIIAIARAASEVQPPAALPKPVTLLLDATDKTWSAYTGLPAGDHQQAAAIYVLDLYGGVEAQQVVGSVAELPTPEKIIGWARGAQYRCNI